MEVPVLPRFGTDNAAPPAAPNPGTADSGMLASLSSMVYSQTTIIVVIIIAIIVIFAYIFLRKEETNPPTNTVPAIVDTPDVPTAVAAPEAKPDAKPAITREQLLKMKADNERAREAAKATAAPPADKQEPPPVPSNAHNEEEIAGLMAQPDEEKKV